MSRRGMCFGWALRVGIVGAAGGVGGFGAVASAQMMCANPMVSMPLLNLLPAGQEDSVAVVSGAWSDPATWGGVLPLPGDDVLIPAGIEVVYDVADDGDGVGADSTRFGFVRVDGTLRWALDRSTVMYVDTLFSSPGGVIEIGTDGSPLPAGYTAGIVTIADVATDPSVDVQQLGRGFVPHGTTRVVGADKTDFAALAGDALAGATTLTLREAPVGWEVGDTLVLGGTSFDPSGDNADNSRFRDEVLRVTAIDGATVTFENEAPGHTGLRWDHVRPDGAHFDPDDLTLYVANLTRNIVFRSELDAASPDAPAVGDLVDRRRGHTMVMHTNDVVFRNAAFVEYGRSNKNEFVDDVGQNVDGSVGNGLNRRGRYSFHLHRNLPQDGSAIDTSMCQPAVVTGCVAHGSPGWGFVHHDSHAVFEDNVAFDILGSAFVQESGNEIGLWRNNISIKTTGDDDPDLTVEPFGDGFVRVTRFDFGFNGEAYWVQGASQVRMIDNVAISAAGGGMDLFSDVDGNSNRDRTFVPRDHLPEDRRHIVTSGDRIAVNRVPTRTISGFEVYNSDFGFLSWNHMRNQGDNVGFICPCDGNVHREYGLIEGFKFWNIYGQGVHLQYSSQLVFRDGIVASSDLATPGIDDKPALDLAINGDGRGYGFGMNGPTKRLVLENIAVEGWLFGVRTPLEGQINRMDTGTGVGTEGSAGLPLRRSVFRDLKLANNTNNLYRRQNGFSDPQGPSNFLVIDGGDFAPVAGNQPPIADFTYESIGDRGVVRLSGLASRDFDTPGDGLPANNPLSAFVNDDNYIVSYAWDFDGDGMADAHGETVTASFVKDDATPVTLTVWDHQGLTDTVTLSVTPGGAVYGEAFVDGGFDADEFEGGIFSLESADADRGWFDARASLVGGRAILAGEFDFSSIAQTVYDDFARRGPQRLSFDIEVNDGSGTPASRVVARVFGINGEFDSSHSDAVPIAAGAVPVEIELLYEERFDALVQLGTVRRIVDAGPNGYQYLYVGFEGDGLDASNPNDFAAIDNVSLTGELCAGDANGSFDVTAADISAVLDGFGGGGLTAFTGGDVTGDGRVTALDISLVLSNFGVVCQ